jgi:hypothetical protein
MECGITLLQAIYWPHFIQPLVTGLKEAWIRKTPPSGIILIHIFMKLSRCSEALDLAKTNYLRSLGKGALFSEVKRPGREADRSPPSSAEVKNASSWHGTQFHTRKTLPLQVNPS